MYDKEITIKAEKAVQMVRWKSEMNFDSITVSIYFLS